MLRLAGAKIYTQETVNSTYSKQVCQNSFSTELKNRMQQELVNASQGAGALEVAQTE